MKLSRKIKLYSSLASFAVLGGIAITAASCAENSSAEKSSSPDTDKKQPAASEGSGEGSASAEPAKPTETKPGGNDDKSEAGSDSVSGSNGTGGASESVGKDTDAKQPANAEVATGETVAAEPEKVGEESTTEVKTPISNPTSTDQDPKAPAQQTA